ncbi:MAG: deoxyguanosinetriphosphate triphosphohydrolase [Bacteroides sp.]|nr:deoxyguanosinetriphosphate triphosphohydrolase [Bacteroides sp.]MDD2644775.1 deoxyguanosinetriphosphate triphosphohydrolase [Bacteroides sp.]NLI64659.1 deoxyguanosinetriphosphate triphosphohydrolase [Bacteroidales bacterium]
MNWENLLSTTRFGLESFERKNKENRSEFQRDYDRLIFSAPFRRLQNKTQVFPLPGSVFVHNRLTHSLEVSCVGRSLGNDVAKQLIEKSPSLEQTLLPEIGSIVSAACLAHDLGNPPFGHSGEKAIATYFSEGEGQKIQNLVSKEEWQDLTHFEGNANAFRLLTHQFNGRRKGGFVMTYSTLASIVKYPYSSLSTDKQKFGFFNTEIESFKRIADKLKIKSLNSNPIQYARYPLVYLVEAADDICYQVMDIEDACKLKILSVKETQQLLLNFFPINRQEEMKSHFKFITDTNEQIAYLRSSVIGLLIRECIKVFVNNEAEILQGCFNSTLIKSISEKPLTAYKQCSKMAQERIYNSQDVVDVEIAGYKIITNLLDLMIHAVLNPQKAYSKLLINRASKQYNMYASTPFERIQSVLDYISGMTDVFALDLYQKINGTSLPSI